MKITFDSNVFQSVVEPSPSLSDFKDFFLVKEAIKSNKISPFISESIFCLEALNNDDRQPFINNIKHNYKINEKEEVDQISIEISMYANSTIDITMNEHLQYYWDIANKDGFKILSIPRIGLIKNKDMKEEWFAPINDDVLNRMSECGRSIEEHGCGIYHIKALAEQYRSFVEQRYVYAFENAAFYEKFKYIKLNDEKKEMTLNNKIAKAFAEWADGDTVAAHYAYRNDYICTNDIGRSAGSRSIFSSNNRAWLKDNFGIEIITPKELVNLILKS